MFGQSLLSGAFGTALVPDENFGINLYTGSGANQIIGGKTKGASSFNGSSSNIELGDTLPGQTGATAFSWSIWFYAEGSQSTYSLILDTENGSSPYNGVGMGISSTTVSAFVGGTTAPGNMTYSGNTYTANVWNHLVLTYDGSGVMKLYLNKVEIGSGSNITVNTGLSIYVGSRRAVSTWHYFKGALDQLRIFNTELSSAQVTSLYAETASEASTLNFPTGAGCVAAYQFDTNANTVLSQGDLDTLNFPTGAGCIAVYTLENTANAVVNESNLSTCNFPAGTGCQALYQFNDTSNDTCGNYNLTEVGSPSYVSGVFDKAIQFNGTSQGVTSTSAVIPNPAASISLWYNGNGTATSEFYIIGVGVGGGSTGLDIHYYNGNFYAGLVDAGSFQGVGTGSTSIDTSTWYHLTLTWDGSTSANSMKFYINGILETSITPTVAASSLTYSSFGIGKTSTATYAPGIVDQVRIFDTVLSASQVRELQRGYYPGTPSNITYPNGVFNKAASFNGSSSKISLGNQTFFNAGDYSVSFWLNNQGNDSNYQIIMSQRTSSDAGSPINISMYGVSYGSNDGKLYFAVGGSYFVSNTVLSKNTWYHLVFTIVAGGNMNIYVDGVLDSNSTTESTTRPTPTTQNLAIGANGSNTDYPFNGLIDQVRFFNTALTQSQVTELARGEPKYNGITNAVNFNGWTNFKPGFTWFKKRNGGTGNNILINSPGLKTSLSSNATYEAGYYDQYGYLSSFEDYGFATAAGSNGTYPYDNVGESGSDYVSWNWKAGAETYSTYFNGTEGSGGSYAFGVPAAAATALRTAAAFSISIWANPDQTAKPGAYDPEIIRFLNDTYLRLIHQDGGTVRLLVNDSSNTSKECISSALTPGKWTHICATGSSSGLKLYIDGTEVDSDTWDGTFWTYSSAYYQNNTIGSAENTGGSPPANPHSVFKGYLSQYRLYNAQLTPTQVSTLYNETAATNATLNYPAGAGAIALYQLKGNCTETSGTYSPTSEANLVQSRPNYLGGNTNGTMPSQVNANADAGFSIVKYIGNGTSGATIGHGLGKIPELAFFKNMDQGSSSYSWSVYSGPNGPTGLLYLNDTYAFTVTSSRFNDTAPTNQVFTLGNDGTINASGNRHIAYCWTSIDKYSKIGSYVGNNPTAVSVDLGFAPSWIMVKNTTSAADWVIYDNKRNPTGNFDNYLLANLADAEGTTGGNYLTPTATGFTTNSSGGSWVNENGSTFIYLAFA